MGTSIGGGQAGTAHSSPFGAQSVTSTPRNIEIRIRTGAIHTLISKFFSAMLKICRSRIFCYTLYLDSLWLH